LRIQSRQRSGEYALLVEQLQKLTTEESVQDHLPDEKAEQGLLSDARQQSKECSKKHENTAGRKSNSRDIFPIALAAVWELLQCCVGAGAMAGEAAKAWAEDSESDHRSGQASPKFLKRQGPPPCVRWYDARSRVALGLVSLWLQVPRHKLSTLEVLLGSDKAPTTVRSHAAAASAPSSDRYRYLKVGLAAAGGGALFAVTGGLAAPALAAAAGSILGIVPGAGAAAGAVAGFMSTQVGVAAVTTTMATAGAATTGSKMAYRTADVKDFGFRELKEKSRMAALTVSQTPPPPQLESLERQPSIPQKKREEQQFPLLMDDPGHLSFSSSAVTQRGTAPLPLQQSNSSSAITERVRSARVGGGASLSETNESIVEAGQEGRNSSSTWKSWFGKKEIEDDGMYATPLRDAHPAEGVKLSTVVTVSGWISNPDDFCTQWECIRSSTSDKFSLVWCTSELQMLSSALGALLAKGAAGQAAKYGLQHMLVGGAGLVTALGPTVILGAATGLLIENAWTIAGDRADKAGKLLAQVLMTGGAGGRPVTLISHSMGSRLVFSALLELCRCGARGLVENVVLLGAPVSPGAERCGWRVE